MVKWFWFESTKLVSLHPVNTEDVSELTLDKLTLDKLMWLKLCKGDLAPGFLRDLRVNTVMIQVFLSLPLLEKVTWLTENLIPRKGYPSWNGEKLRINQTDHTETIAAKWLSVFQQLDKVPYKEVGWWACTNFTDPEYRWVGCSGISSQPGLFFRM
jgi:hypothetical protein